MIQTATFALLCVAACLTALGGPDRARAEVAPERSWVCFDECSGSPFELYLSQALFESIHTEHVRDLELTAKRAARIEHRGSAIQVGKLLLQTSPTRVQFSFYAGPGPKADQLGLVLTLSAPSAKELAELRGGAVFLHSDGERDERPETNCTLRAPSETK